ncbi:hypothetical protein [Modestobacter italicus]|uniref:hypothetical protein n=1 Tax=Modestobacter italicus (strain DSM 44449 / CECT 9708 / BC 501) TaxID=2732864 RepID=UPI00141324FF|nr:hypothetical protein [Modestobacter marinus]
MTQLEVDGPQGAHQAALFGGHLRLHFPDNSPDLSGLTHAAKHAQRDPRPPRTEVVGLYRQEVRLQVCLQALQLGDDLRRPARFHCDKDVEVMRRAGHSSSRAAMIYQHAAERRDAEVAARLGRLAAGTNANRTGTQRARRGR